MSAPAVVAGIAVGSAEEARAAGRAAVLNNGPTASLYVLSIPYHRAYVGTRFEDDDDYKRAKEAILASPGTNRDLLAVIADARVDFVELAVEELIPTREGPALAPFTRKTWIEHTSLVWRPDFIDAYDDTTTHALRLEVLRRVPLAWLRDYIEPEIRRSIAWLREVDQVHIPGYTRQRAQTEANARLMAIVHAERLDERGHLVRSGVYDVLRERAKERGVANLIAQMASASVTRERPLPTRAELQQRLAELAANATRMDLDAVRRGVKHVLSDVEKLAAEEEERKRQRRQ